MPIELRAGTRVVVVAVAVDEYEPAAGGDEAAFEALDGIASDLLRLQGLFDSPRYRHAGFEMLPPLRGSDAADLHRQLRQLRRELDALSRDLDLVVLWTGHGEMVDDELRLVTRECTRPLHASDGLSPGELVSRLQLRRMRGVTLLLDVCQAAAAAGPVLAAAAKRLRSAQVDTPNFAGALFAAYPFQAAWDSAFVEALTRLLAEGPSPAARQRMEERHAHRFHEKDRELTLADVSEVLLIELDLLRAERDVSDPVPAFVNQPPRLFPNPLFREESPAQLVEVARRRRALAGDIDTHFLPKARGLDPGEEGWTFTGRTRVSAAVVQWLQGQGAAAAQGLLVLTGDGGTGKSALIGRLVTLEDAAARELARRAGWDEATDQAAGTVPPAGCIDAALHLRRRSHEQVMQSLAELLAMPMAQGRVDPTSFVASVPVTQGGAVPRPTTLVLDALDEANDPARIAQGLIVPLLRRGCRVLLGTRRRAAWQGAPELLPLLGDGHVIDLDREPDTPADLAQYVQRRLAAGAHAAQAAVLAQDIARRADGRFLYARMAVAVLGRQARGVTVDGLGALLGQGIGQALLQDLQALDAACLQQFPALGGRPATALFAALAYAEGAGLPLRDGLWPAQAHALLPGETPLDEAHALWLLREGGQYIVEDGEHGQAVYRLYHQALVDELRRQHGPFRQKQAVLAQALQQQARDMAGWEHANPYALVQVLRHLQLADDFAPWVSQALDFAWMQAFLDVSGIHALLALLDWTWADDRAPRSLFKRELQDPFMRSAVVTTALRQSSAVLSEDPRQLPTHLIGRLSALPHGLASVQDFLRDGSAGSRRPWLRPITPALSLEQSIRWLRPTGHSAMQPIAFSRDGRRAVHCDGRDIHAWDLWQWQELGLVHRPGSSVHALAVSDDGLSVIHGDSEGRVFRWRGGRSQGGQGHDDVVVQRLQASADGRFALSHTSRPARALVAWDFDADRHEVVWSDALVGVAAFALAGDGRSALVCLSDGWLLHLQLWPRQELDRVGLKTASPVVEMAWSSDQKFVAVACRGGAVQLLRFDGRSRAAAEREGESTVTAMAWSSDATRLFLGREDGRVQAWAVQFDAGKLLVDPKVIHDRAHSGPVQQVSSSGTRHDSFLSADSLRIKEWRQTVGLKLAAGQPRVRAEAGLLPGMDGATAVGHADGALRRWGLLQADLTPPLNRAWVDALLPFRRSPPERLRPNRLVRADASPRVIAVGDDRIEVWDIESMTCIAQRAARRLGAAAISPDGTCVAFVDGDDLSLWDVPGDVLSQPSTPAEPPRCLAFSPDGAQLLGIGCGREVLAWWIDEPEKPPRPLRSTPDARDKPSAGLYVGPRLALVFSGDGEAFLVDTSEPGHAAARPLQGRHRAGVHSLLFDDDARRLVTASWDGSLAVWDIDGERLLQQFEGAGGPLHQLSRPFGQVLMGTHGGVLRIVSLLDGRPILNFQADHQIIAAAADPPLMRIAAADQSGLMHILHVVEDGLPPDD